MHYIGCDQHKRFCVMTAMDQKGNIIDQQKLYHDNPDSLKDYLQDVPSGSHMAVEACGYDAWLCDLVESYNVKIHLAHPLKTKAIAQARIKNDELDSKTLAELLRGDLISESYYAPADIRQKRYFLRYRLCLVKYQTSLKNRIHNLLGRQGILTPSVSDLFGKEGRLWLESLNLPSIYQHALQGYLSLLDTLKEHIKEAESKIRQFLKEDPQSELLKTIPGIGALSAYLLLTEIGPITRFPSAEKLCSYMGIIPSLHQSGSTRYHGAITKQGNPFVRWVLVEAAHVAVRKDPGLAIFYRRILMKKGANKAVVAAARKLLVYVYMVLTKNEPYRYHRADFLPNKPVLRSAS